MKLNSLSVFFPCYNEAKNITLMVADCYRVLPQVCHSFEIIIIDDGSTDSTQSVVKSLQQNHPNLKLVSHPQNQGYGASVRSGIKAATNEWLFFTDGDRQFDISQLTEFIPHTEQFDAIIGRRTNRAEGIIRALNARLFKLFVDIIFRLHVKDIDCAFKLFKSDRIQNLPLISNGAMISTEILYRLKKQGVKFKQLPVNHYPRLYGSPTGNNPKVIIKAFIEAFKLYLKLKFFNQNRSTVNHHN